MKRLIMAEFEYARKRLIAALAFVTGPMLILMVIDPFSGGVIPFEESFFLPVIYLLSLGPAMLFILGQGANQERVENRVRLQMTLPLSRLRIAIAHQALQNGALAAMVTVWSLLAVIAGAKPVAHDVAIWLLTNALFWGIVNGTTLAEQVVHASIGVRIGYKAVFGIVVAMIVVSSTLDEMIFNILKSMPLDATVLINLMKGTHLWMVSLQGAITLMSISLLMPILGAFLFTKRNSFLKK